MTRHVLLLPVLVACQSSIEDTAVLDDTAPLNDPLEWQPCDAVTDLLDDAAASEECVIAMMPLQRDVEGSEEIEILVRRIPATEPSRGQLWFLGGGPGASTAVYSEQLQMLAEMAPDLDVYSLSHRGTLGSTILWCSELDGTGYYSSDCIDELEETWGDGLAGFSGVEAALDVIELIRWEGEPEGEVIIHGLSYGGWWLNRILQLAPELPTAVIWDGPSSANMLDETAMWSVRRDEAIRRLMEDCAADATCASWLGEDPYATTSAVIDSYEDVCAFGDRLNAQAVLLALMEHPDFRALIPGTVARMERCSEEDETDLITLNSWLNTYFNRNGYEYQESNTALFELIRYSEMIAAASTSEQILSYSSELISFYPYFESYSASLYPLWPLYEVSLPGEWTGEMPPSLCIVGDYDSRTAHTACDELEALFPGAEHQYVEMHNTSHSVLNAARQHDEALSCAVDVVSDFLADPEAPVGTACVDALPRIDFSDDAVAAEYLPSGTAWPE